MDGVPAGLPAAGGVLQGILFPLNLGRLGNSVALWLNIEPYELFFYVFLPPLLLDAAVKLDFFLFKKVPCRCFCLSWLVRSQLVGSGHATAQQRLFWW